MWPAKDWRSGQRTFATRGIAHQNVVEFRDANTHAHSHPAPCRISRPRAPRARAGLRKSAHSRPSGVSATPERAPRAGILERRFGTPIFTWWAGSGCARWLDGVVGSGTGWRDGGAGPRDAAWGPRHDDEGLPPPNRPAAAR